MSGGSTTGIANSGSGGTGVYYSEYVSIGGYPSGWFAGGAGGGNSYCPTIAVGGNGGGGDGGASGGKLSTNGVINTGGGGGGAAVGGGFYASPGGSGIIILRVPDVYTARFSSGVSASVTKSGGYKYYKVTATSTTSETVSFS
jgi:hypothetical protein